MMKVFVQARREWVEFKRDRLGLALAFVLPVATLILFGYGVRLQARNIPLLVQDMDNTSTSRALVGRIWASHAFVPAGWHGATEPEDAIRRGEARGAIVIPHGFGQQVDMGKQASVETYVDGSDINSAEVVKSVARGVTASFAQSMGQMNARSLYVMPALRVWFNPGLKEAIFIAPGVFGIILWMYPALLAAVAASREIEQGNVVQVYASTLGACQWLLGKGLVYFIVGMAQALLTMIIASILFGLRVQVEPSLFFLSTVIYVAAAVSFGLLAGVFTRHETVAVQATATGGFFPSLLLSGFVYPIANIPYPLSLVCMVVPARYYIEVSRDCFERGIGWPALWYQPLILLAFAFVLFALAWMRSRSMQVSD